MQCQWSLAGAHKTILITEMEELTNYLNDVVIYHKDNSFTEHAGQGVIFMLMMADGTQIDIMAFNPFLIIDGVGYKTKFQIHFLKRGFPKSSAVQSENPGWQASYSAIILITFPSSSVVNDIISAFENSWASGKERYFILIS